jgi:hypothetical protein
MATLETVRIRVRENLEDNGINFYSNEDIDAVIQDAYYLLGLLVGAQRDSTTFNIPSEPYIETSTIDTNFFALQGIFNNVKNCWLDILSSKEMKLVRTDWELWQGSPQFAVIIDFNRLALIPSSTTPSGTLTAFYIKVPPELVLTSDVIAIADPSESVIENYATADLLEQVKEISKARRYWEKFGRNFSDCKAVNVRIARADMLRILRAR